VLDLVLVFVIVIVIMIVLASVGDGVCVDVVVSGGLGVGTIIRVLVGEYVMCVDVGE
jgi:hypothetical protein